MLIHELQPVIRRTRTVLWLHSIRFVDRFSFGHRYVRCGGVGYYMPHAHLVPVHYTLLPIVNHVDDAMLGGPPHSPPRHRRRRHRTGGRDTRTL